MYINQELTELYILVWTCNYLKKAHRILVNTIKNHINRDETIYLYLLSPKTLFNKNS